MRYPIQAHVYVKGYSTAIENNKQNIIDQIKPHAKQAITNNDEKDILEEVVFAAEFWVATIVDDGPSKTDKDWKDAIKYMKKLLPKLEKLNHIHFNYLDSELRRSDDTYQLLQYHSRFYVLPDDDVITFGELHLHIIKSIMLWDDLLKLSLKGKPAHRGQERNPLINYCHKLHGTFEKYTGLPLTLNSPFERFAWECLKPLQGIIKHNYTEESLKKSIRALQKLPGAKSSIK